MVRCSTIRQSSVELITQDWSSKTKSLAFQCPREAAMGPKVIGHCLAIIMYATVGSAETNVTSTSRPRGAHERRHQRWVTDLPRARARGRERKKEKNDDERMDRWDWSWTNVNESCQRQWATSKEGARRNTTMWYIWPTSRMILPRREESPSPENDKR